MGREGRELRVGRGHQKHTEGRLGRSRDWRLSLSGGAAAPLGASVFPSAKEGNQSLKYKSFSSETVAKARPLLAISGSVSVASVAV